MADQLVLGHVSFKQGSYIVVEGKEKADRFFIIQRGKVKISKEVEVVAEDEWEILGPGDFFGVVSTMSSHSHIETAQALTDVFLISVAREQYSLLIQNNSQVAMKIILQFSKRLRFLDEAHTRLTLKNTADEDPSHLFNVAEYYLRQSLYNQAFYAYTQYLKICPGGKNVALARERMMKIGIYVKGVRTEFDPEESSRMYPKNNMLFAEGEPGNELFIIQKGSVKITKIVNQNEVLLAVLKAGDIFGEMALLESKPRAASAVAYEDCQVLAINRANFEVMITSQPQLIARLTTLLSERIWSIYKQLANTLITNPLGRMYDALLIQVEKKRIPIYSQNSFDFDFGPRELTNMVGLPKAEASSVVKQLLENKKIIIENDRIRTTSVAEIAKEAEYHKRMQRIEKARQESRSQRQRAI